MRYSKRKLKLNGTSRSILTWAGNEENLFFFPDLLKSWVKYFNVHDREIRTISPHDSILCKISPHPSFRKPYIRQSISWHKLPLDVFRDMFHMLHNQCSSTIWIISPHRTWLLNLKLMSYCSKDDFWMKKTCFLIKVPLKRKTMCFTFKDTCYT